MPDKTSDEGELFDRIRSRAEYTGFVVPAVADLSPEQVVLLATIRSMEARVRQRTPWVMPSLLRLLEGAAVATVLAQPPDAGRRAYEEAKELFESDVQTKNRMFYLLGALIGLVLCAAVTVVTNALSNGGKFNLATPPTIVSLFTFATLGSVASVLTRMSTIDLRDELRKKFVVMSAAVRPLVAIAFASIVYVILSRGLISFGPYRGDCVTQGLTWVAAFLCGFSERFAIDILDRLPFGGRGETQAGPRE